MRFIEERIDYYIDKLRKDEYYSIAGFSDAEWYSMLGVRIGGKTALGQHLDMTVGMKLRDIFTERKEKNFLYAAPKVMKKLPAPGEEAIDAFVEKVYPGLAFYERDMVTDDLAADAGLYHFINQLRNMDVYIIGNKSLRNLRFLKYKNFFEISSPNFHLDEERMNKVVKEILDLNKPGVYLFSSGVSAALMISRLHGKIEKSFFLDCGSIWDAFVGIGEQREWRKRLYDDPNLLIMWKNANLRGIPRE